MQVGAPNCSAKIAYKLQFIVFEKEHCSNGCGSACRSKRSELYFRLWLTTHIKSEILMRRSSDILLPRALLSIQQMTLRPVLAMVYAEGLIEFRETSTLNVLPRDGKDQISSMAQIGLYFPGSRFCVLHLSPMSQTPSLKDMRTTTYCI